MNSSREDPDNKRLRLENSQLETAISESLLLAKQLEKDSTFSSIEEFKDCLKKHNIPPIWTIIEIDEKVIFVQVETKNAPEILYSIVVDSQLNLKAFVKNVKIEYNEKQKFPSHITNINDLLMSLDLITSLENSSNSFITSHISHICDIIEVIQKCSNESKNVLDFIKDQLKLLNTNKHHYRYSSEFLILSSLFYSISPHSYSFIRNSGSIILPHASTIRKLCLNIKSSPREEQFEANFLKYAKEKYVLLQECDKKVILLVDEIHIKPFFEFNAGNILGMGTSSTDAAKSAQVFMISSLLSPYKDVIHIVPVKSFGAEMLHSLIKNIIIGLEKIGFFVFCVVSDNNAINRKSMTFFCNPPALKIVYPHPADNSRPLFYAIDSVHILKCIRNNWLNQKNIGLYMHFPNFDDLYGNSKTENASFNTLKKMHELEYEDILKFGYGLTLKALCPTNLERQNMKLVLQIFNDYIVTALEKFGIKNELQDSSGTKLFIEIILRWWKIVNVKTPNKGLRLNDNFMKPLTLLPNDNNHKYLEKLLDWLDAWKLLKNITGNLTNETHTAITHTTYAILEIARYCIEELQLVYFLPGKIQTDALEERFGKYRMLAGSQYNVSIRQIFESEAKMRIQNTLPLLLNSSTFGAIEIKKFEFLNEEINNIDEINENLQCIVIEKEDIDKLKQFIPVLTYLAGYCIHMLMKTLKCKTCGSNLTTNENLDNVKFDYINSINRGSLKYPHSDIISIVTITYAVIQKLMSTQYETEFLKCKNHRYVAITITLYQLDDQLSHLDVCDAGHKIEDIIYRIIKMSTNTLLKNYCAKKNDVLKKEPNKRKLSTFNKENYLQLLPK